MDAEYDSEDAKVIEDKLQLFLSSSSGVTSVSLYYVFTELLQEYKIQLDPMDYEEAVCMTCTVCGHARGLPDTCQRAQCGADLIRLKHRSTDIPVTLSARHCAGIWLYMRNKVSKVLQSGKKVDSVERREANKFGLFFKTLMFYLLLPVILIFSLVVNCMKNDKRESDMPEFNESDSFWESDQEHDEATPLLRSNEASKTARYSTARNESIRARSPVQTARARRRWRLVRDQFLSERVRFNMAHGGLINPNRLLAVAKLSQSINVLRDVIDDAKVASLIGQYALATVSVGQLGEDKKQVPGSESVCMYFIDPRKCTLTQLRSEIIQRKLFGLTDDDDIDRMYVCGKSRETVLDITRERRTTLSMFPCCQFMVEPKVYVEGLPKILYNVLSTFMESKEEHSLALMELTAKERRRVHTWCNSKPFLSHSSVNKDKMVEQDSTFRARSHALIEDSDRVLVIVKEIDDDKGKEGLLGLGASEMFDFSRGPSVSDKGIARRTLQDRSIQRWANASPLLRMRVKKEGLVFDELWSTFSLESHHVGKVHLNSTKKKTRQRWGRSLFFHFCRSMLFISDRHMHQAFLEFSEQYLVGGQTPRYVISKAAFRNFLESMTQDSNDEYLSKHKKTASSVNVTTLEGKDGVEGLMARQRSFHISGPADKARDQFAFLNTLPNSWILLGYTSVIMSALCLQYVNGAYDHHTYIRMPWSSEHGFGTLELEANSTAVSALLVVVMLAFSTAAKKTEAHNKKVLIAKMRQRLQDSVCVFPPKRVEGTNSKNLFSVLKDEAVQFQVGTRSKARRRSTRMTFATTETDAEIVLSDDEDIGFDDRKFNSDESSSSESTSCTEDELDERNNGGHHPPSLTKTSNNKLSEDGPKHGVVKRPKDAMLWFDNVYFSHRQSDEHQKRRAQVWPFSILLGFGHAIVPLFSQLVRVYFGWATSEDIDHRIELQDAEGGWEDVWLLISDWPTIVTSFFMIVATTVCTASLLAPLFAGFAHWQLYTGMMEEMGLLIQGGATHVIEHNWMIDLTNPHNIKAWLDVRMMMSTYMHHMGNFYRHFYLAVFVFVVQYTGICIDLFDTTFSFNNLELVTLYDNIVLISLIFYYFAVASELNETMHEHVSLLRAHQLRLKGLLLRVWERSPSKSDVEADSISEALTGSDHIVSNKQKPKVTAPIGANSRRRRVSRLSVSKPFTAKAPSAHTAPDVTQGVSEDQQMLLSSTIHMTDSIINGIEQGDLPLEFFNHPLELSTIWELFSLVVGIVGFALGNYSVN